jgi:hypothetical protein
MNIVVLGSGPAGLMAAQGAADAAAGAGQDLNIAIITAGGPSPLYGAQYLHEPIPGFTKPEEKVAVGYTLRGHVDDYRRKVYGNLWDGTVSPEDLSESHDGYDIRGTYRRLWEEWESAINIAHIDPFGMSRVFDDVRPPSLVINSIPRPVLCHAGHSFGATEVWAAGDAPELGISIPYTCPKNMVVCNGEDSPAWYRMSNIFGRTTVEWPGELKMVPVKTAAKVQKPTKHNCDCWSDSQMIHVGRYGEWSKGVLSHTAYVKAYAEVTKMVGVGHGSSAQG